jgi:tight adherence protein C
MEGHLGMAYLALGALAFGIAAAHAQRLPPLPRVELGRRGEQRRAALAGAFGHVEPLARWLGARCAALPLQPVRARLDVLLIRSGSFLGLCADELLGLCALSAAAATALSLAVTDRSVALWVTIGFSLGAALPLIVVRDHKRGRDRRIARQLPPALDLFALALNAGFDFSASAELVQSSLIAPQDPLRDELGLLLQELALGRSRARALRSLGDRTDVAELRDLVRVVIQAERKGTPLAEVLEVQAQIARNRRSVLAEEAAARASILLLAPLMLILLAMLLLLLGPLAIRSFE